MVAATKAPGLSHIEAALLSRLRSNRVRVPPYPAVAARLQQLVADPRHTTAAVSRVVAADATLAATIVARASSASHGGKVASLDGALARLGVQEVMRLALSTSLGVAATTPGPLAGLRRDAWRRAVIAARLAHDLATARGLQPDEAFVAGLLHDFGEVVAIAGIEALGAEHELPVVSWGVWQTLVQRVHVEVGTVVAARWQLPPALADVMAHHHCDDAGPLPRLVALVDTAVDVLDGSPGDGIVALCQVPKLTTDDRTRIIAALPYIVRQMADLETPPAIASAIAASPPPPDSWPLEIHVSVRGHEGRTQRVTPTELVFVTRGRLEPNWLADVIVDSFPESLMVNIASCEPCADGFTVVARPFGLGGPVKTAWQQLLATARARASRSP